MELNTLGKPYKQHHQITVEMISFLVFIPVALIYFIAQTKNDNKSYREWEKESP